MRPGRQLEDPHRQLPSWLPQGEEAGGGIEGPAALSGGLAFYKQRVLMFTHAFASVAGLQAADTNTG